jgi:hypothetical protein
VWHWRIAPARQASFAIETPCGHLDARDTERSPFGASGAAHGSAAISARRISFAYRQVFNLETEQSCFGTANFAASAKVTKNN